jgi:mono/diheme cytochrome c family protein
MYKLFALIFFGIFTCLVLQNSLAEVSDSGTIVTPHPGKAIYDTYCLTCHQADGKGVPGMNPPIVKTDWVLGDKTKLINVLLKGIKTPLVINGETYHNPMPSHAFLTDAEIANVLTYIRSNFGNKATAVTADEVKTVRALK